MSVLSELVEQILESSMERRQSLRLEMEYVKVLPVLEKVVRNHQLKSEAKPWFDISVDPDMTVKSDRRHFTHIVSNIIDNAIKYSPTEPRIAVRGWIDNDRRRIITVKDNGIGIAEDRQRFVFDKFYRVPGGDLHEVKGYGLGLYYVKSMMDRFGGSVTLKSRPGKGTVFKLVFNE